jgi:hypothetical protein
MADPANTVGAVGVRTPGTPGDVPERLRRRYFTEERAREHRFYVDAQVKTPVFLDRGRKLIAPRSDPNAVRDMVAIAQHRGWSLIEVRGTPGFRREAWLAGRTPDLEVRGYQPTQRDLQELDRRREGHTRLDARLKDLERGVAAGGSHRGAADRLKVIEAVVKSRVVEPAAQDRVLHRARERVADLLERGGRFDAPKHTVRTHQTNIKERFHPR